MEEQDLLEVRLPGGRVCLYSDVDFVLEDGKGGKRLEVAPGTVIELLGDVLALTKSGHTSLIPLARFRRLDFDGLHDVASKERVVFSRLLMES